MYLHAERTLAQFVAAALPPGFTKSWYNKSHGPAWSATAPLLFLEK